MIDNDKIVTVRAMLERVGLLGRVRIERVEDLEQTVYDGPAACSSSDDKDRGRLFCFAGGPILYSWRHVEVSRTPVSATRVNVYAYHTQWAKSVVIEKVDGADVLCLRTTT